MFTRSTALQNDDCYQNILQVFSHAGGKGRPHKLQANAVTNRLLLQLFRAKEETGISWVKLEDILQQSECFKDYPRIKYRGFLHGTVKHAESLCPANTLCTGNNIANSEKDSPCILFCFVFGTSVDICNIN